MKKLSAWLRRELLDYKLLLRHIPSLTVSIFILSVVCANLFANKELVNYKYVAIDCGTVFSWILFLCMDIICKHWGGRAAIKVSLLALGVNLAVCGLFFLLSLAPGKWGAFYGSGLPEVNDALNDTFGGSWYVVLGSALAFLVSSIVNAVLNTALGAASRLRGFTEFAFRSYLSTAVAQLVDNMLFTVCVSKLFFGWTWTQVFVCAVVQMVWELVWEMVFSGFGYRIVCAWEKDGVGQGYFDFRRLEGGRASA